MFDGGVQTALLGRPRFLWKGVEMQPRRWLVLCVACGVVFGPVGHATEVLPLVLSGRGVLREVAVLEAPERHLGFVLLGVADVNQDGFPDLVVAGDRKVEVLFGDGQGRFSPGPWVYLEVKEYREGEEIPGRFLVKPGEAHSRWVPYELEEREGKKFVPARVWANSGVLADLDGDGVLDVAVRGVSDGERQLYLLRGQGDGRFARASSVPYPSGLYFSPLWPAKRSLFFTVAERDEPHRLYRVDLQQGLEHPRMEEVLQGPARIGWAGAMDGVMGLVLYTEEKVWFLLEDGEGGFRPGPEFTPPQGEVRGVAVVDLDQDGSLDLVVRTPKGIVSALRRASGFSQAFSHEFPFPLRGHWLADLTGDSIPDLLVQRATGFSEFYVLPGTAAGGFLEPTYAFVVMDGVIAQPHFADLNADGLLDVVFAAFRTIRVYLNGGTPAGTSLHPLPGALLAAGDLSGNGAPDLVAADVETNGVKVLWNDGQGGLIPRALATLGRLPLAAAIAQNTLFLLLPATKWLPEEVVAVDPRGRISGRWPVSPQALPSLAVADLDGDTIPDVTLPAKDELLVLWGGNTLIRYPWPQGEVSFLAPGAGGLWAVSIGEYADLVEVRFSGRQLAVSPPLLQLEALPLTLTAGDLDGDGIHDPVVLAVEVGVEVEGERAVLFPERVVAGMVLSTTGPVVEEVPSFPKDHMPWPFLGAAVARIAGTPHLVHTTSAGGGVFLVPWRGGFGEPIRMDVPGGPVIAADLDGNGEDEVLTATVGLATLLAILWNGGGR